MITTYLRVAVEVLKEATEQVNAETQRIKSGLYMPGCGWQSTEQKKGYYAKLDEINRLTAEIRAKREGL